MNKVFKNIARGFEKAQNYFNYLSRYSDTTGKRSSELNPFNLSRLTADWLGDITDINSILRSGTRARKRSREMARENPYCKKYLKMLEKNIIGPDGFTLRNKAGDFVKDENNKTFFQFDKLANQKIYEGFSEWSKLQFCTVTEDISFREACSLIIKTIATDGEILIRERKFYPNKFGYALQLIPCDYLDETYNAVTSNGTSILQGVELNKLGKPVAYWLKKETPSSLLYGSVMSGERFRVAAEDPVNGNLYHLFVKESPNQKRGIPWFVPGMIRIKMLDGYEEAVLVDARLNANRFF
ncbi:MAG: phage portal protein, partial [Melioribacter sp.]|nr:phage portal protein [Melioribacter sp.]